MIKKHLPFHQFKKIDESVISGMMETEGTCISFDLPSINDMISSAEDGYYHDSDCEVHFYLSKYKEEPITVFFELSFSFDERHDPGDYFQPPDYEVINENLDIWIEDIVMENYDLEIDLKSDEIKKLENFIENLLTD
jgi:hypothetical protein